MLTFKFKWLDENGNEKGFRSKRGSFDGATLKLDDVELPAAAVLDIDVRGSRMAISVLREDQQTIYLLVNINNGNADELKQQIGVARSATWAASHQQELSTEGRSGEFRSETCPHCTATIDLTGFPKTPQIDCEFCHVIGTLPGSGLQSTASPLEKNYRLCDECGMYSYPRKFTVFYFYFLLVIYGVWHKETWRCPGCMRGDAWKMLFGNLPFLLGVPVAIVQLFRAYGGTDSGNLYRGLDSANVLARRGKTKDAIEAYQKILANHPIAAGVKYNIGCAFLHDNDAEAAATMFEFALEDCANHRNSAQALAGCLEQLGRTEELADLRKRWGVTDEAGADEIEAEETDV
jgi:tetratricopeptide (TPR) repeat protein